MKMNFKRIEAKSRNTKSIVIFLHGYGADGSDLLSIGSVLSDHLPDTLFVAPDAPTKCQMSPFGFQWFPIPDMDGSPVNLAMEQLDKICLLTNNWIDKLISDEGVQDENVFLFGFSQGTMLSLYMGPQRRRAIGGIIGFSGKLINAGVFRERVNSRPPILLIHGDEDQVVIPTSLPEAYNELTSLNFTVQRHLSRGIGHGIAPDGLTKALAFICEYSR
ncbi:MAG: phospholipase [Rhodobacteraceae bacterium]|nr:MAG: phospholipase [Paracoccaceae bacterium]